MNKVKLYAVKGPNGKIDGASVSNTKIAAIYSSATYDYTGDLYDIVWYRGSTDDESIRKRVKRSGYKVVPVKVIEIKG